MFKIFECNLKCGITGTQDINKIIVHGAKEHNLKNICLQIPKGKLIALTGPSGSGKSTIANDILQKECIRQYLESLGMTTDHIEKAKVDSIMGLSPSIGVSQRVADFNSRSTVGTKTGILTILRNLYATLGNQICNNCTNFVKPPLQDKSKLTTIEIEDNSSTKKRKKSYFECMHCKQQLEKLTMGHFSFNSADGACDACKGAGEKISVDISRLLDFEKTVKNGGVNFWDESIAKYYESIIASASKYYNFAFDPEALIKNYSKEQLNFLLYGISFPDFANRYKNIKAPKKVSEGNFEGVIPALLKLYKKNPAKSSNDIKKYILSEPCTECENSGLAILGRQVTVNGKTLIEIVQLSLTDLLKWIEELYKQIPKEELQILRAFSGALKDRISNLIEVGLHYLTLDRTLPTLSTGESQRLRLANLLGSGLTGVLYVLDEPTTGLHPYDTSKLLKTIKMIQEAGNTVLVIEHDVEIIKNADYIIDMGPSGGSNGGEIIVSGTPEEIMACNKSITGKYLDKKMNFEPNPTSTKNKTLIIRGASQHNLKNIDVTIPINKFIAITGVSGSGKSTFVFDILDKIARKYFNNANEIPGKYSSIEGLDNFNRIVTVDQVTIGNSKSTRSNVATYTKLFDKIRDLFASLPKAKNLGFDAETFSFNTSPKRCQNCNGAGAIEVDMTFMPDIEKECPSCDGARFDEELLTVKYKGYNIADILNLTVSEAIAIFNEEKKISAFLNLMKEVNLEYLKLGQSTSTLSGGEAQRIKLASELAKSETGKTLYLLDEPTTGLHSHEVEKLLNILRKLVAKGNTVVVIEHNLDVICKADMIVDFGPGGGIAGGKILATGTVQEVISNADSFTGKSLKDFIEKNKQLIGI